jgi:hypothetical protein
VYVNRLIPKRRGGESPVGKPTDALEDRDAPTTSKDFNPAAAAGPAAVAGVDVSGTTAYALADSHALDSPPPSTACDGSELYRTPPGSESEMPLSGGTFQESSMSVKEPTKLVPVAELRFGPNGERETQPRRFPDKTEVPIGTPSTPGGRSSLGAVSIASPGSSSGDTSSPASVEAAPKNRSMSFGEYKPIVHGSDAPVHIPIRLVRPDGASKSAGAKTRYVTSKSDFAAVAPVEMTVQQAPAKTEVGVAGSPAPPGFYASSTPTADAGAGSSSAPAKTTRVPRNKTFSSFLGARSAESRTSTAAPAPAPITPGAGDASSPPPPQRRRIPRSASLQVQLRRGNKDSSPGAAVHEAIGSGGPGRARRRSRRGLAGRSPPRSCARASVGSAVLGKLTGAALACRRRPRRCESVGGDGSLVLGFKLSFACHVPWHGLWIVLDWTGSRWVLCRCQHVLLFVVELSLLHRIDVGTAGAFSRDRSLTYVPCQLQLLLQHCIVGVCRM